MHHSQRRLAAAIVLTCSVLLQGCGGSGDRPPLGQVNGQVTYDGKPVSGIIISFQPKQGRAATAQTDAEGRYELIYRYGVKGAKIGPNTVNFAWPMGADGSFAIAEKYAAQSIFKREVKAGTETMDFKLTSN